MSRSVIEERGSAVVVIVDNWRAWVAIEIDGRFRCRWLVCSRGTS